MSSKYASSTDANIASKCIIYGYGLETRNGAMGTGFDRSSLNCPADCDCDGTISSSTSTIVCHVVGNDPFLFWCLLRAKN